MPTPAYQGDDPYVVACYAHQDSKVVYREVDWFSNEKRVDDYAVYADAWLDRSPANRSA